MLSDCVFNKSINRQFRQEKCHCLWLTEPCVNVILMHCRDIEKITRWNEFISGNAKRKISTSQKCQTWYWKKMGCQKQPDSFNYIEVPWVWWPLMYSKHQDSFLETSCPWLEPNRQSSRRDRLIPKLSPRRGWSRVQTGTHMGKKRRA